ncbi:MAG: hypothetical protein P4M07_29120 [Xanthobacteraceae bacterium]|nr:hypothetical protein [Xanthobacteraceae bacterium]
MSDFRDTQNGVNDPVDGADVTYAASPLSPRREQARVAAAIQGKLVPTGDEFLPEALRRPPAGPLNKRTGRHPSGD